MTPLLRTLLGPAAAACFALLAPAALAQPAAYPALKPIQLVVPFPPGGVTDSSARLLAQEMEKVLNQRIVVENKAGAGGMIAGSFVARSAPDGYTVCFCTVNPAMLATVVDPNPPYQPLTDLAPVGLVSKVENSLIARTGLEANSLPELMVSLYSGDTLVQQKRAKPLAVAQGERSVRWPAVPTMQEAGFPGLVAEAFAGLNVAAGTPPAIIDTLNAAMVQALRNPALRKRFQDDGNPPVGSSPAEYGAFLRREAERWAAVAKAANLKLERQ